MKPASLFRLLLIAALPLLLGVSSSDPGALDFRLFRAAEPYVQTVTGWMIANTVAKLADGSATADPQQVRDHFAIVDRLARAAQSADGPAQLASPAVGDSRSQLRQSRAAVESAIQREVADAARRSGLGVAANRLGTLLPPVLFRFETPPSLLIVSPRDHIERAGSVLLKSGLSDVEAAAIEDRASAANVAALVTPIGGLGVYPAMVPESPNPQWTFRTVAHEWVHQFLATRPLGWRYAFGGEADSRMITVNETVAELVGRELGDQVYSHYYSEPPRVAESARQRDLTFRAMMRDIRTRVDSLLAAGEVAEAERFMEESRSQLAERGYNIRKLNQAYFAFFGSYADEPSAAGRTGADISERMRRLRDSSGSLGEFLWRVSSAGSFDEFLSTTSLP